MYSTEPFSGLEHVPAGTCSHPDTHVRMGVQLMKNRKGIKSGEGNPGSKGALAWRMRILCVVGRI